MIKVFLPFLFSFSSLACSIEASDYLYSYGLKNDLSITSKSCTNEELSIVKEVILESEGTLDLSRLKRATGIKNLSLKPSNIIVKNLEKVVHRRLNLPENIKLEVIAQNISKDFFNLSNGQFINAQCTNCTRPGIQNLRLTKNTDGRTDTIWVKAKVQQAVKAVVTKSRITLDFNGVKKSDFKLETVYTTNPSNIVSNLKQIEFYRLNKPVSKGHIIRSNDLTPIQLVKYGTPAKVILDNFNLSMSTYANPLSTGKLGETIKLKNLKSNKVIFGKITGKNEVKVEL